MREHASANDVDTFTNKIKIRKNVNRLLTGIASKRVRLILLTLAWARFTVLSNAGGVLSSSLIRE
jgi:hypothetical protein